MALDDDWFASLFVSAPVTISQQNVRQTWQDEVSHLTPWVIDHLSDLAGHLGVTLDFVRRETPTGSFRADIEAPAHWPTRPAAVHK